MDVVNGCPMHGRFGLAESNEDRLGTVSSPGGSVGPVDHCQDVRQVSVVMGFVLGANIACTGHETVLVSGLREDNGKSIETRRAQGRVDSLGARSEIEQSTQHHVPGRTGNRIETED